MENQYYRIPEVMRRLMCEDKRFSKDANVNGDQVQHLHHASLQHRLTQVMTMDMRNQHHLVSSFTLFFYKST